MIVPVPRIYADKLVYVPPLLNVNPPNSKLVVATVNAVEPKLRVLKQLLVVNVATAVPLPVNVKLGASLVARLPTEYVLVMAASAVKPPVPVQVKPVAVARFSTVVPAVVCTNAMLPEPNATLRGLKLPSPVALNWPVVNVNPARSNVPLVNVVVAVTAVLSAPAKVVVPEELVRVNAAIVLPFGVIVPVPRMLAVNPV